MKFLVPTYRTEFTLIEDWTFIIDYKRSGNITFSKVLKETKLIDNVFGDISSTARITLPKGTKIGCGNLDRIWRSNSFELRILTHPQTKLLKKPFRVSWKDFQNLEMVLDKHE